MAMLGVFAADRARLPRGAPLRRPTSRTPIRSGSNLDGTTIVDGEGGAGHEAGVARGLGLGVTPIGPTWDPHHYFLGADNQGRDVAARLLYGGRNSLLIGISRR